MIVRCLPLILALGVAVPALAPLPTAAQEIYASPGQRTDGTPSDREAANGALKPSKPEVPGQAPAVELGEVQGAPGIEGVRPEDVAARYVTQAAPYTTDPPPKAQARAFPPERIRKASPDVQDHARSVEERQAPGG